jgi:SAM-dependent methyltransferase
VAAAGAPIARLCLPAAGDPTPVPCWHRAGRRRTAQLGLDARASFAAGDLAASGLADASCDAVISLDVLLFVPRPGRHRPRCSRILRPGGRFAFTTWERPAHPAHLPDPPPAGLGASRLSPAHRQRRPGARGIHRTTRLAGPAAGARRRHYRRRAGGHGGHGPPLPGHGPGLPRRPAWPPVPPRLRPNPRIIPRQRPSRSRDECRFCPVLRGKVLCEVCERLTWGDSR